MEEEKQSRAVLHLDIAKRIVEKLADAKSQISQKAVLQVLQPLLEDHIPLSKLKQNKMPVHWFTNEITPKDDFLNELSSYLQRAEFTETNDFNKDLEYVHNQFKASIKKMMLPRIEIANKYQSLHIGCNNYEQVKSESFKQVKKSHDEVKRYTAFFKNELDYDSVIDITDQFKTKQVNLRSKILEQLESMVLSCDGIGKNPFSVNVITFSGHGITFDGDAIAAIPEYQDSTKSDDQQKVLRFINFTDWARRFAERKNTLSIFILSMCRIQVDKLDKAKVFSMADGQLHPELNEYQYLFMDAQGKYTSSVHEGYSVMLFGTRLGKVVNEGDLIEKFFDNYLKIKQEAGINMGWEIINRHFYEDQLQKISSKINAEHFERLRFLADSKQSEQLEAKKQHGPQIVEVGDIFDKSQCSTDPQEKVYFKEIMENKKFKTELRYRASRDGQMIADLHRMVDGKESTVSLFKIKENGQCVGGFTTAQWASPESLTPLKDSTALLFNLTTQQLFKSQDHSVAFRCAKGYGPVFGNGELYAYEPFNGNNKCYSCANRDGYRIEMDSEWVNKLTNLKCGHGYFCPFTISELEIWEVTFS